MASRKDERKLGVIKCGTGLLASPDGSLNLAMISSLACQIAQVLDTGLWQVIIVSSGAMLAGRAQVKLPKVRWEFDVEQVAHRQILSGLGQGELIRSWNRGFEPYGYPCEQVLLTNEHFSVPEYLKNLREKLKICLQANLIPVCNEHDWETKAEVGNGFTDNDQLGYLLAREMRADLLAFLCTAPGLMLEGRLVELLTPETICVEDLAQQGFDISRGGMSNKTECGKLAQMAGSDVHIVDGRTDDVIVDILLSGARPGTFGRGRK